MKQILRTEVAHRWCAAATFGDIVFLCGHTAKEARGESVKLQTEEVLRLLDKTLANMGCSKADILGAQIFLADIAKSGEMNEVWDAWVPVGHPAARACVGAQLPPGVDVEITATAARRSKPATVERQP